MHFTGELSDMKTRYELVSVGKSDECGCPEEEWVIGMVCATIHLEPTTGGHVFLDCGDWQAEELVNCTSIEELRVRAVEWINKLPINNEL